MSGFKRALPAGFGLLLAVSMAGAWQQRVAYDIKVRLDTKTSFLYGQEQLHYWNNSPDTLTFVWIHLYPNAYRNRSTTFGRELEAAHNYNFSFAPAKDRGYIEIDSLSVDRVPVKGDIHEAEMKVALPAPLAPGDSTVLDFAFRVKVPAFFSRLGHKDEHYVISQWYPKMVVYDPYGPEDSPPGTPGGIEEDSPQRTPRTPGGIEEDTIPNSRPRPAGTWHPDGYHATGEFYGEFGTFDVAVTVPADVAVGATGDMVVASRAGNPAWNADSEQAWMMLEPARRQHRRKAHHKGH